MSNPTKRGLLAELESLRAMVEELEIVSFAHAASETDVPHLRGDALLVEKSEAASALIYRNGKRYVWSQRGG